MCIHESIVILPTEVPGLWTRQRVSGCESSGVRTELRDDNGRILRPVEIETRIQNAHFRLSSYLVHVSLPLCVLGVRRQGTTEQVYLVNVTGLPEYYTTPSTHSEFSHVPFTQCKYWLIRPHDRRGFLVWKGSSVLNETYFFHYWKTFCTS